MADLFMDYKKKNSKKTLTIITTSFVFALSFNAFLFWTDTGGRLQTSVLNSWNNISNNEKADILLESAGTGTDMIKIRAASHLENVSKMYLSLAFDPGTLTINDIFSADKNVEIVKNSNVAGVSSLTLLFKTPQKIAENGEIATIVYKKKKSEKTVLNLAETQFKSMDGTIYNLTNSSVEF